MTKYACPCCGYKTFDRKDNAWEICPVCFWQNDTSLPHQTSGANNGMTLVQAQQHFISFGACDISMLKNVRFPRQDEARDENWQPYP